MIDVEQVVSRTSMPSGYDLYVFDLFTPAACKTLLSMTDAAKHVAPNSMNKYGLVLRETGFGWLCDNMLKHVVNPLARRFYTDVPHLRGVHGFLVDYSKSTQASLAMHHDDSLVTLNVCLGRNFEGGKLVFEDDCGRQIEIEHEIGQAVLHRGKHLHQARAVRKGRRTNLILWCKRGLYR